MRQVRGSEGTERERERERRSKVEFHLHTTEVNKKFANLVEQDPQLARHEG